MAEQKTFSHRRRQRLQMTEVIFESHTSWIEMNMWLSDPKRPGYWDFDHTNSRIDGRDCWTFLITDPDVAMEFKLRFV